MLYKLMIRNKTLTQCIEWLEKESKVTSKPVNLHRGVNVNTLEEERTYLQKEILVFSHPKTVAYCKA